MESEENYQSQNQNIQSAPPTDGRAFEKQPTANTTPIQPQVPQQPQGAPIPPQPQPQVPSQLQHSQAPQPPPQGNFAPAPNSEQVKPGKSNLILIIGLILLAAAIIIGVASFFMRNKKSDSNEQVLNNTADPTQSINKLPSPTPNPTANWKSAATKYYTIKYPTNSDLNTQEDTINISYWGPTQTKDTELFDGYSITFQPIETTQTPQEYAKKMISEVESTGISEITEGSEPVIINGYDGVTYTEEGLGTYKHYMLGTSNSSVLIQISILVTDPGNLGFQDTVDNILSTLEFIPGV